MTECLIPAPPKAWCYKCGTPLQVCKPVAGDAYWVNTGEPQFYRVGLNCPNDIFLAKGHSTVYLIYPTENNPKRWWYSLEHSAEHFCGLEEEQPTARVLKAIKDKAIKGFGEADVIDSFIATGEAAKEK